MVTTNTAPSYRSKERKSLCEESMLLVVNILRLSSLSLATRNGTRPNGKSSASPSITTPSPPSLPPINRDIRRCRDQPARGLIGKRAMKLEPNVGSTTTRTSYVMLPVSDDVVCDEHHHMGDGGGDVEFAEYIRRFHRNNDDEMQNANVEGRASDYIKRFHEKNKVDDQGSKGLPFVVQPPPPPPPPVQSLRQRTQPGSTNRRLSY